MNNQTQSETLMRELISKNTSQLKEALDECKTDMERYLFCRKVAYGMSIAQFFLRDFGLMQQKIKMLDSLMK